MGQTDLDGDKQHNFEAMAANMLAWSTFLITHGTVFTVRMLQELQTLLTTDDLATGIENQFILAMHRPALDQARDVIKQYETTYFGGKLGDGFRWDSFSM